MAMKKIYFQRLGKEIFAASFLLVCTFSSAMAQNNAWTTLMPPIDGNGQMGAGDYSRIEVSDLIAGPDNSKINTLTLATWVKINKFETPIEIGKYLNAGNIILGHRQACVYGYGSEPSFAIILTGENENSYQAQILSRGKNAEGGFASTTRSTAFEIPMNEWAHVVLTAKVGEDNALEYEAFVNGKSVCNFQNNNNVKPELPYLPDKAGDENSGFTFGEGFPAEFTDLMIWNKALTAEEISASMVGYANPETVEGLIGYYPLDELGSNGECVNLGSAEGYNAFMANMSLNQTVNDSFIHFGAYGNAENKVTRTHLDQSTMEGRSVDITSERPVPLGGNSFYADAEGTAEFESWQTVEGDIDFRYAVNSTENPVYRKTYGGDIEAVEFAVYHRGDINNVTYVGTDDVQTGMLTEVTETSIKAGLEYSIELPAEKWMTAAFPVAATTNADGVSIKTYTAENKWNTVETAPALFEGAYVMSSVEAKTLNVVSEEGKAVIIRMPNAEYSSKFMGKEDEMNVLVGNPYLVSVDAEELCASVAEKTLYKYDEETESFVKQTATFTVAPLEAFIMIKSTTDVPESIKVEDEGTGLNCLRPVFKVNARGIAGAVEIETMQDTFVEVYSLNGVKVASMNVEGTESVALDCGVYLVKTAYGENVKTIKVVVE